MRPLLAQLIPELLCSWRLENHKYQRGQGQLLRLQLDADQVDACEIGSMDVLYRWRKVG